MSWQVAYLRSFISTIGKVGGGGGGGGGEKKEKKGTQWFLPIPLPKFSPLPGGTPFVEPKPKQ